MVAITVVLAAVLYVMVMGFSQGGGANTPSVAISKTPTEVTAQYRISLVSITSTTVKPTDITIIVTPALTHSGWTMSGSTNLGAGDYFLVNSTVSGTSYTIMLRYIPTSNSMGTLTFTAA
jgi:FlaG/FlaF family flagellin (archaellin)